jgi:hypothetical protein
MTAFLEYIWLGIYLFALLCLFAYGMNCYLLMIFYRRNRPLAVRRHQKLRHYFYQNADSIG